MNNLQQTEQLLSQMSRAEKAQILQWVVRVPGTFLGSVAASHALCVHVSLQWLLVQARHLGSSEADLLQSYPTLRAEDLANVWAYYRSFRPEIDQQIQENETA